MLRYLMLLAYHVIKPLPLTDVLCQTVLVHVELIRYPHELLFGLIETRFLPPIYHLRHRPDPRVNYINIMNIMATKA